MLTYYFSFVKNGFINAVLYIARSGSAWRDLPERYGTGTVSINASIGGQNRADGKLTRNELF